MKNQRSKETEQIVTQTIHRAPLLVTGILAETTITVRDLLQLSVGDIIVTEKLASKPVVVAVEGEKKFFAQLGQHRGSRALKVARIIGPDDRT